MVGNPGDYGMSGIAGPEETTTPVDAVLRWLPRVTPEVAAELLVGCGFHDGQPDTSDTVLVTGVDVAAGVIMLAGGGRASLRQARYRDGEFVDTRPGGPLSRAVASARTPAELRETDERLTLLRHGIETGKLPSDEARRAVLAMLEVSAAGTRPDARLRDGFYRAMRASKDRDLGRVAARLMNEAFGRFERAGDVPEDIHWRRASLLRQAGLLREAVQASEVLYGPRQLHWQTETYLASTRAAALLELSETRGARDTHALLNDAARALNIARRHDGDNEQLIILARTLRRLREQLAGEG